MGINCKIHYTADGRVDFVEAPDGQRSELFDTLNDTFGEEKALDYFALTESETIKNKVAEKQNKYRKEKLSKLEEPKFSIIGEKGASRVEEYNSKLNDAKELEKQGKNLDEIAEKTGWYKQNNQWKYLAPEIVEQFQIKDNYEVNRVYSLQDILQDKNTLLQMYPEMGSTKVVFYDSSLPNVPQEVKSWGQALGAYDEKKGIIGINTNIKSVRRGIAEMQRTLGHELTHITQQQEGFSVGGDIYSVLRETQSILGIDPTLSYREQYDIIKVADISKLTENKKNIVKSSLDTINAIVSGNLSVLYRQYRNILGEVDARIVEDVMDKLQKGEKVTIPYNQYLQIFAGENNVDLNSLYLLSNGDVSFSMKNDTQEVIDRLKQTGLANNVYQLSTEDINNKLKELGVSEDVRKQVLNGNPLDNTFDKGLINSLLTSLRSKKEDFSVEVIEAVRDKIEYDSGISELNDFIDNIETPTFRDIITIIRNTSDFYSEMTSREIINSLGKIGEPNIGRIAKEIIKFQNILNRVGVNLITNGFVYNNEVFLNKSTITAETPIHEFSHLFNSWIKQNRPELYNKGLNLVSQELNKSNSEIQDIINYVRTTQPTLEGETLLEEILTELTGRKGAELLNSNSNSGIINWLKEFWNEIKDMLGLLEATPEQVANMSLQDFTKASVTQLLKGDRILKDNVKVDKFEANGKLVYEPTFKGQKMGALRLTPHKNGYKVDSVVVYDRFKNKGVAKRLYNFTIKDLVRQGKSLYSLNIRAPYAENIWNNLVEQGVAKKQGKDYVVEATPENLKEADVKTVVEYANSTLEPLSREETISAKDSAISFGVTSSSELSQKLKEAFIDENGAFIFDRKKMEKAGYNSYETTKVMSDLALQDKIRNLIPRLKNTSFELEYDQAFVKPSSEINDFGKQVSENPYIVERNERPQENVKVIKDGEIVDKIGDTEETLKRTYPIEPKAVSQELSYMFNTIQNVTENVAIEEYKEVQKVVKAIKKEAVEFGVDLKDAENRIIPIQKLKSFMKSLNNYILNPTKDFAKDYDTFFEINEVETEPKTTEGILLDTDLTEYELFKNYNLVRKEGNVYTEVEDTSLEDIYTNFFIQQENLKTKEEVQAKTVELEVEDFNVDSEVLEAMYMWKSFLGYPIKTKSNTKPDFIDIKEAINNPYKKVTSKGVELINNDPITESNSKLFEKEKEDYSAELDVDINLDKRKAVLEGKVTIEKIKTDYNYAEDNVLITKNNENYFVRTPQGTFEKVYEEGDLSFYKKVISEDKNLSNMDLTKYFNQQVFSENIIEAKQYYSAEELKEINDKYFACE